MGKSSRGDDGEGTRSLVLVGDAVVFHGVRVWVGHHYFLVFYWKLAHFPSKLSILDPIVS